FLERVDEQDTEAVVAHAFDLASVVAEGEEWRDFLDFFRAEADVLCAVLLPGERDRAQAIDDIHATGEGGDVVLVTQTRRASRDRIGRIEAQWISSSCREMRQQNAAAWIYCQRVRLTPAGGTRSAKHDACAGGCSTA